MMSTLLVSKCCTLQLLYKVRNKQKKHYSDLDDLMGETYSDENGNFFVAGYEDEITRVFAKLNMQEPQMRSCIAQNWFAF